MSLSQTINYNNGSNFTFDSTKVQFTGGVAFLKLQEDQEIFSQDFSSDVGFAYNSTTAEFDSGLLRQKSQAPANSLIAATYTTLRNLSWSTIGSSLTANLNGLPTVVSNKLVCTGSQGVYYTKNTATIETLKVKYTPNYTGAPPENINIIGIQNGSNNNDRVNVTHSPSGDNFRLNLYNSVGVNLVSTVAVGGARSFVAGTTYEIEAVINSVSGTVRFFVDGVLIGTNSPGAWTRGTSASRYHVGANALSYNRAEGSFEDYIAFSNAQHTASYTPGYSLFETLYVESKIDLPNFEFGGLGSIVSVDSATVTEAGSVRYIVAGRYWSGSAWSVSNGSYSQASSFTDITSNLVSFPATGATIVPVSVVFGETNTQQSVDAFQVTVTGTVDYPVDNPTILINSYTAVDDIVSFIESATKIGSDEIKYTLNLNGSDYYWNGSAWVTSNGTYAQSNTASEINTNLLSLDISTGRTFKVKAFLHSEDGSTTPILTSNTYEYDFFAESPGTIPECVCYLRIEDLIGEPFSSATLRVSSGTAFYHTEKLILPFEKQFTPNALGYIEASLIETETVSKSVDFSLQYVEPVSNTTKTVTFSSVQIPNSISQNLAGLLTIAA